MALPPSEGSDHAHVHPGGPMSPAAGDPDVPTAGELMRRMDQLVGEIAGLAAEMREERRLAEKTYVRQDLWLAQVKADQMMTSNVAGDVRALEQRQDTTEIKRRQNFQFSLGLAVSVFALLLTLIGFIVNRSSG